MDERRLTELFAEQARAAADDAPPATFSHAGVVATSRRQTQRRHQLAVGGVTLGLVALLGAGIGAARLADQQGSTNSAAAPGGSGERAADAAVPDAAVPDAAVPGAAAAPAPATTGCVTPDVELATALGEVLPTAAGAVPQPVPSPCTAGARAVQLAVTDAGRSGTVRVVLGAQSSGSLLPAGGASRTVRTAAGASLTVSSLDGVLTDRLDAVAQALAARF